MLVEAGCAELTLAQCQLSAPGNRRHAAARGVRRQVGSISRPPLVTRRSPQSPMRSSDFQRELPALGGGLAFDSYGGAINAVARPTRPRSSTATRSASCR
jgi:hypothetical protein